MSTRTAVRRNRRHHYVSVESATVRDHGMSFRALGLLTFILDQSDEWKVRSEQLSKPEGREGRDAVRKALHELAARGYYRLERRRFLDGTQAMGAAVSEFPVEQWAADYKTFAGKLDIPVVEQADGSFRVRYADGSLGSDGFEQRAGDAAESEPESDDALQDTEPVPENAGASADAAPPPKRGAPKGSAAAAKRAETARAKAAEKKRLDDAAQDIAKRWWEHANTRLGPFVGAQNGFVAMRQQVRSALAAGYTVRNCEDALVHANVHWPSRQQWQVALGVATRHISPPNGGRPKPYSDQGTWGTNSAPPGDAASTPPDDADDAVFGVLPA